MKDKVLLDVVLPATQKHYEVRVPYDITVEDAARMISGLLASQAPGIYDEQHDADLIIIDQASKQVGDILSPREVIRTLVENEVLLDGTTVTVV